MKKRKGNLEKEDLLKFPIFRCPECGYKGGFELNFFTAAFAVGRCVGASEEFVNPADQELKVQYERQNANRGLVCPQCSCPLSLKRRGTKSKNHPLITG